MSVRDLTILGCSSQQPTRHRNHGAYLLRWNGEGLLFDPGEGTQRQFIFANIAPTVVTRMFVSHFHGDHCLGLGSMLMRLNLDKVTHPIHCYFPSSGRRYFERLQYGTIYHEATRVIKHPVHEAGLYSDDEKFKIETTYLKHGVDCLGWRITEPNQRKFCKEKLAAHKIRGPMVHELEQKGELIVEGERVTLDDVSWVRKGDSFVYISDTRFCQDAIDLAKNAKVLLCESTYLESHQELAIKHQHMTARQAATLAKEAHAEKLILTHFSARYLDSRLFEEEARQIFPNTYAAEDLKVFSILK
ncbi:MAG: ribonuclease Z [Chlamydiia bacterium]|nr:ribonuclease Z [Chlamydiia bacterium]